MKPLGVASRCRQNRTDLEIAFFQWVFSSKLVLALYYSDAILSSIDDRKNRIVSVTIWNRQGRFRQR